MTGRLAEKVALITGTSPNICGGIAEGMAEEGAKIVCVDIQPDNANLCADYLTKRGGQAIGVVCDVTNENQVQAAVERARQTFGGVDILIEGYHGLPTHKRYFLEFLPDTGVEVQGMRIAGTAKALGNGHAVIENPEVPFGRPIADWIPAWGEAKKAKLEAIYRKLIDHFGAERAYKIAKVSRNLLIFPNLVINDIMSVTVRTFFPLAPDSIPSARSAWPTVLPRGQLLRPRVDAGWCHPAGCASLVVEGQELMRFMEGQYQLDT